MLSDLQIRDFVLADDLSIEFEHGLSVLTGETGAGKSILIGALGLILGARADSQTVRHGAEKTQISAIFELGNRCSAHTWLEKNDLTNDAVNDSDDDHPNDDYLGNDLRQQECIIRRVVRTNGRSRAFINGKPVTLQQLKELGRELVDIHGQHENQRMMKPQVQRELLDQFGEHYSQLTKVKTAFTAWTQIQQQLDDLHTTLKEKTARMDLLRFQTQEISDLGLTDGEFEQLADEQHKLHHVTALAEYSQAAIDHLADETNGAYKTLFEAQKAIDYLTSIDPQLTNVAHLIDSAVIQVNEALAELQHYYQSLDMDPQRQEVVESRLHAISALSKKHQVDAEQLNSHLNQLLTELHELDSVEDSIAELERDLEKAASDYIVQADKLTTLRKKSAKKMSDEVTELVRQFGMPSCIFSCAISKQDEWKEHGFDTIRFTIQPNQGEPERPMAKIASGGELSRLSLAVQVVCSSTNNDTCMVFDEVDAGVGGAVADMIGQQLKTLGNNRQVLAVTHLPQVACHSHHHYKVSKKQIDQRTHSQVNKLNESQIIDELARMLGGVEQTATTKRHAKELRHQAKNIQRRA